LSFCCLAGEGCSPDGALLHDLLEPLVGAAGAKRERPPLFPTAAKDWFESKTALTRLGRAYYRQYVGKLTRYFGNRLISDITAADIARLQRKRMAEGLSGRQVNCEIATLRNSEALRLLGAAIYSSSDASRAR